MVGWLIILFFLMHGVLRGPIVGSKSSNISKGPRQRGFTTELTVGSGDYQSIEEPQQPTGSIRSSPPGFESSERLKRRVRYERSPTSEGSERRILRRPSTNSEGSERVVLDGPTSDSKGSENSEDSRQPGYIAPDQDDQIYEKLVKQLRKFFSTEILPNQPEVNIDKIPSNKALELSLEPSKQEENLESSLGPSNEEAKKLVQRQKKSLALKTDSQKIPGNQSDLNTEELQTKYINLWVVHLTGGLEIAKRVIEGLGYTFKGRVKGFDDLYTASHNLPNHDHRRETRSVTDHINSDAQVLWAEQQVSRPRDKRRLLPTTYISSPAKFKLSEPLPTKSSQSNRNLGIMRDNHLGHSSSHSNQDLRITRDNHLGHSRSYSNQKYLTEKSNLSKRRLFKGIKRSSNTTKSDLDLTMVKNVKRYERMFNDELWDHQWYLFDSRTRADLPELDLRVVPVWDSGITGKGINVLVIDDGLEWSHDDIVKSYNPSISYDLNDDDPDPTPSYDESRSNGHGTKCAGEIVMQPNNEKCGVGVAYGASIGGIRLLDGEITDDLEGASLAMGLHDVDVVSCSWGPLDDGKTVEGPGYVANLAIQRGITEGREGKGIIYVWAAGNGGSTGDNCNCDGYTSSIYTISVNSADENGGSPWYTEHCTSTLTSTHSSGAYSDQKVVTTDLENDCTISFTGTSAATPLAAGIIALALEANPNMTWIDMQHAIVQASDWRPLSRDTGWKVNGAGYHYNFKFGFGLLTAEPLVNLARRWVPVPEGKVCQMDLTEKELPMVIESGGKHELKMMTSCNPSHLIGALEHVQLVVSLNHTRRGALEISLTSPSGTVAHVLTARSKDNSTEGFDRWAFTSVHTWGEDPAGEWTVRFVDTSETGENGIVSAISLILRGI